MGGKVLGFCRSCNNDSNLEIEVSVGVDNEDQQKAKSGFQKISESNETRLLQEENREFDLILSYIGKYIEETEVLERLSSKVKQVEETIGVFKPISQDLNLPTLEKGYILFNEDQSIYKGGWIYSNGNFEKHGCGILINNDGSKFDGIWDRDQIVGYGRYISNTGSYYEGEWKDECANGKGKFVDIDGTIYEGEWKNDQLDGFGSEILRNGVKYEGNFNEGEKTGFGKFIWEDGAYYEGEFLNSMLNGKGFYKFSDERTYDGEWKNNKLNGKGIFKWPNGNYYEGGFKNDVKDGFGVFYSKEKIYEGNWLNGKAHGKGKLTDCQGKIIKGTWRFGKLIKKEEVKGEINKEITNQEENNLDLSNDGHKPDIKISSRKSGLKN